MLKKIEDKFESFDYTAKTLFELCKGRHTGVLYIFSSDAHGATISLSEGKIIDIAYLKTRGMQALEKMQKITAAKYAFKQDSSLWEKQRDEQFPLPADNVILSRLGVNSNFMPEWMGEEIKKILVVDDSALSRKVIVNIFADQSYDITEAVDGLDALDKLRKDVPDLVLLDLVLPKLDGYEVLNTMKKNSELKNVPVIMLTSRDALMDKIKGKMSATDEYMTKPVDSKELMNKVKKYLRK